MCSLVEFGESREGECVRKRKREGKREKKKGICKKR